ncbi:MAG: Spx/MgsR family RNA polymerase-binding regulatory protein [Bacteriovoracaceae bacterium]|nr:Spx/MgsR family RNA polymerase-binding regulatory protein [Bacteriovoracaceae bacterium]
MIKLYGIPNCDTVKKAKKHLESIGVEFDFVNFKKDGVEKASIERWKKFLGEWPVNKRGRTFKQFKDEFESASDSVKIKLIQENTSLIKRPVLEKGKSVMCLGFDLDVYNKLNE